MKLFASEHSSCKMGVAYGYGGSEAFDFKAELEHCERLERSFHNAMARVDQRNASEILHTLVVDDYLPVFHPLSCGDQGLFEMIIIKGMEEEVQEAEESSSSSFDFKFPWPLSLMSGKKKRKVANKTKARPQVKSLREGLVYLLVLEITKQQARQISEKLSPLKEYIELLQKDDESYAYNDKETLMDLGRKLSSSRASTRPSTPTSRSPLDAESSLSQLEGLDSSLETLALLLSECERLFKSNPITIDVHFVVDDDAPKGKPPPSPPLNSKRVVDLRCSSSTPGTQDRFPFSNFDHTSIDHDSFVEVLRVWLQLQFLEEGEGASTNQALVISRKPLWSTAIKNNWAVIKIGITPLPLKMGDQIYRRLQDGGPTRMATHHGIYLGDGFVLDYSGPAGPSSIAMGLIPMSRSTSTSSSHTTTKLQKLTVWKFMNKGSRMYKEHYDQEDLYLSQSFLMPFSRYKKKLPLTHIKWQRVCLSPREVVFRANAAYAHFHRASQFYRFQPFKLFEECTREVRDSVKQQFTCTFSIPDYQVTSHNCEHFARWCKIGLAQSTQVDTAHSVWLIGRWIDGGDRERILDC